MRFLQREGARAPSLVVISFKEQSLADQFFQHFNTKPVCRNARASLLWRHMLGKCAVKAQLHPQLLLLLLKPALLQFSSLEPLDVCHVVFVKDLVIAEGPSGAAHLPSPGGTQFGSNSTYPDAAQSFQAAGFLCLLRCCPTRPSGDRV